MIRSGSISRAAVCLLLFFTGFVVAQDTSQKSPQERAWALLSKGAESNNVDTRRTAIAALGVITGARKAADIAEKALNDEKPEVRAAAATALGQMEARGSIPKLIGVFDDKEPVVVLAAAQALVHMGNERGYDIYYEVLTGQRRGGKGAVASEMDILKSPKKVAELGFEEAIGFVPFGGMGMETWKVLRGGSSNTVRAVAARMLASDPDPAAETALSDATGDSNWLIRVAAIEAIARRGDPKLLSPVVGAMDDEKDAVKYSAAAAVVRLTTKRRGKLKLPKPD